MSDQSDKSYRTIALENTPMTDHSYIPNIPDNHSYETLDDLLQSYLFIQEVLSPERNMSISYQEMYEESISGTSQLNGETFDRDSLTNHLNELSECLTIALSNRYSETEVIIYRMYKISGYPLAYVRDSFKGWTRTRILDLCNEMDSQLTETFTEEGLLDDTG